MTVRSFAADARDWFHVAEVEPGVHLVAERSGHLVPLEQAQLVTDAVLAVVEAARSGRLLSQLPFP